MWEAAVAVCGNTAQLYVYMLCVCMGVVNSRMKVYLASVFCSRYISTDAMLQVRMYIVVIVLAVVPLLLQELWGDGVLGHRVRSWLHLL